jgi:hypothetical protein
MNINLYERIWMWAAAVIIAAFIAVIGVSTLAYGLSAEPHRDDRPLESLH